MTIQLLQQAWAKDAACADADPEPFHPRKLTYKRDVAAAKRVCQTCPVMEACLADALQHEEFGVWGGLSERERRRLRRSRRLA